MRLPLRVRQSLGYLPLTTRGTTLLVLCIGLYYLAIRDQADVVAATFATCFIGFLALLVLLTLATGLAHRARFQIHWPELHSTALESGTTQSFLAQVSAFRVAHILRLRCIPVFKQSGCTASPIILHGYSAGSSLVRSDFQFPHRGNWLLEGVQCSISDLFGLSSFEWISKATPEAEVEVFPPVPPENMFPPLAALNQTGNELVGSNERCGDHYDLKSYQPSDGVNRIVWKIFARSGQLISRHPEPSITPEGLVMCYCLAEQNDDALSGEMLRYLKHLHELELGFVVGTLGMGHASPSRSMEQTGELLLNSVWHANATSDAQIRSEIDSVCEIARAVSGKESAHSIILFCSRRKAPGPRFHAALRAAQSLDLRVSVAYEREYYSAPQPTSRLQSLLACLVERPRPAHPTSDYLGQLRSVCHSASAALLEVGA